MRDLVEFLVRALVADPDAVRVEEVDSNGDTIYEVHVADDDLGRVIGRDRPVASSTTLSPPSSRRSRTWRCFAVGTRASTNGCASTSPTTRSRSVPTCS